MKVGLTLGVFLALASLSLSSCSRTAEQHSRQPPKVVTTHAEIKAVTVTRQFSCLVQAHRHVKIRAAAAGNLEEVSVEQGQAVKEGDLLFKVTPPLYQAQLEHDMADVELAQLEVEEIQRRSEDNAVSQGERDLNKVRLVKAKAKLAMAQSKVNLAGTALNLASVKAPFDGLVGRLHHHQGSSVQQGDELTTLSDSSMISVFFNAPEVHYLNDLATLDPQNHDLKFELLLSNGEKLDHLGKIGSVVANFNHETGTIRYRLDFPNPDRKLRHGQAGTVLISQVVPDAVVVPQRATFEILGKRFVYVVDKDGIAHSREIVVQSEFEEAFVIKSGLDADDRFVLEDVQKARPGENVDYEDRRPE
jgi:membrane fusion protein (multidrug efflux system)